MRIGLTGQPALPAATRTALLAIGLLLSAALAACTTVEGTNALTDAGTFEREVMTSTAQGLGLVGKSTPKQEPTQARAPLALPRDASQLPPPSASMASQLPANSDTVKIDTANISQADLTRLRNARVVDLRSLSGRPLTADETRMLTARMQAANINVGVSTADRPLYLPPDDYFTVVGGREAVCKAADGTLVPIGSDKCPVAIRNALKLTPGVGPGGLVGTDMNKVGPVARSTAPSN